MRLLPLDAFSVVFAPLAGNRCGVVDGPGNPGDRMIQVATRELLDEFGIEHRTINPLCDDVEWCDRLLLFGGGSLGDACPYPGPRRIREAAVATGIPCVVLPQSAFGPEVGHRYRAVYVRDHYSLAAFPEATLAPDLALGLPVRNPTAPAHEVGVFLRRDTEASMSVRRGGVDPTHRAWTPDAYINLASQYARIVTDRLHFAICGLLNRRRVTLLQNSYHKNLGMWESWLGDIGCEWSDSIDSAVNFKSARLSRSVVNPAGSEIIGTDR